MTLFWPHRHHRTIHEVPLQELWDHGIRGILLDIDNTLATHTVYEVAPEARDWVDEAKAMGFKVALYSNAMSARTRKMAEVLEVAAAPRGYKPLNFGLAGALRLLGLPRHQVALVGDQLFTDVLGGKLGGLTTVLIEPLSRKEWLHTRWFRKLENAFGRRDVGKMNVLHRPTLSDPTGDPPPDPNQL
ncbi:MAG TPA: YqeG family HAD IIIA-type phosphatase [bacterium]|nr:YqeG family HAD IIIA-type phosphatase [bacterium]